MPSQISNHQPDDQPDDQPSDRPNVAETVADRGPPLVQPDLWINWREFTPARIALGRVGASQPTDALLQFSMAHANARDAVYEPLDIASLFAQLGGPTECVVVKSRATDRAQYLRRPDFGRRLDAPSVERLRTLQQRLTPESNSNPDSGIDLVIVIADGLSALATSRHAVPLIEALRSKLEGWRFGPTVIAEQARVALGDEVGELLNARCVAVLIGERPGLSSPDSLGIYLTWNPRVGRTDAERNCISNIRPAGLSYEHAATKLVALLEGAKRLGATGIDLKEDDGETQRIR
jgi:ethanolamine ammonia-lyase small subunit